MRGRIEKAVLWAAENGIVNGVSETKFCPNAPVKRSEVVALLYRLDKEPKYDTSAGSAFKDVDPEKDSGRFYYDAMCWATQNDIVKGYPDNTFQPNAYCKRGEIVTFLYRMQNSPESKAENPFTDVKADAYYANAVLWAVENGVTTGASATTFDPAGDCTRGQIVTFLYRCLSK